MRSVSPSTQCDLWCSLPHTTGRDCDRQSGGGWGEGWGVGFCQPSSYRCRRCLAAASAVLASDALFSIMPIICGPILISSVSLPVAVLASAMCGIFCLRGPVLWLVSSYVATLFLLRAPARTAATGPLAPLVGAVARAARSGAVLVCFVNGCLQVCEICGRASSSGDSSQ